MVPLCGGSVCLFFIIPFFSLYWGKVMCLAIHLSAIMLSVQLLLLVCREKGTKVAVFSVLQRFLADIISVLGMTISEGRECLKFRMLGSKEELESWGHEYVRSGLKLQCTVLQCFNPLSSPIHKKFLRLISYTFLKELVE